MEKEHLLALQTSVRTQVQLVRCVQRHMPATVAQPWQHFHIVPYSCPNAATHSRPAAALLFAF